MEKKIENRNVRFYHEKEAHMRAWESLHSLDREDFPSQQEFIIQAINSYYERCQSMKADPYLETREKEEEFTERIIRAVEEKVLDNLPALIGVYLTQMASGLGGVGIHTPIIPPEPIREKADYEEVDEVSENELLDFDFCD